MSLSRKQLAVLVYVVVVIAIGGVLRFGGVTRQLVGGDEIHAVNAAFKNGFWGVVTTYTSEDHAVPLALWTRALMELDGWTEVSFRLPVMAAAVSLLLSPLLFWRRLGGGPALAALALFATSPPMIYFSYTARPYSPAVVLLLVTWWAWERWIRAPSAGRRSVFAATAAVAVFFHLFIAFPVAALFLVAPTLRFGKFPGWSELCKAAALVVVFLALLLGPGAASLFESRSVQFKNQDLGLPGVFGAFGHLVGHLLWLELALLFLIILGAVRLTRLDPVLGGSAAAMIGLQVVAVPVLQVAGTTLAWARYLFLVWPVALLVAGVGLDAVLREAWRIPARARPPRWLTAAVAAAGAAMAVLVPVTSPSLIFRPGALSFRSAKFMLAATQEPAALPAVYRTLLEQPDRSSVLLEYPLTFNHAEWWQLEQWQRAHGMYVVFAINNATNLRRQGLHYKNIVGLADSREVAASGASHLVYRPARGKAALHERLRTRYGPPVAVEGGVELYALSDPRD